MALVQGDLMADSAQLLLLGFEEAMRRAHIEGATPAERERNRRRVEVAFEINSALPSPDDLAFLHSGLCQTHLPRSRPSSNRSVWIRQSGRFKLVIQPGLLVPEGRNSTRATEVDDENFYCGVPYGPKARLILIWLQSEGVKDRVVSMDRSMSAWIRSLGLAVTGGPKGTIQAVREQTNRIAMCSFSFQWSGMDGQGNTAQRVQNARIIDGMDLWQAAGDASKWATTVQLSEEFYNHLREHAVPLDQRAVAHLAGGSLGLDLYAFFAHRLHRLRESVMLGWNTLAEQFGEEGLSIYRTAQRIRETLPEVRAVYPGLNVDVTRRGLVLRHSAPPVPPATMIPGARLLAIR
jgi:Plasmid encoded RepA protein